MTTLHRHYCYSDYIYLYFCIPTKSCNHLFPLQVVSLLDEVEAQKLAAVQWEEELTSAAQRSCQDQEALREAKGQLESLGEQAREAMEQLKREVQQGKRLEQEKERLQERVVQLGETREGERSGTQQQPDNQNVGDIYISYIHTL